MKKNIHSIVSEFLVIIETPSFMTLARRRRKAKVKVCVHKTQYQKGLHIVQYLPNVYNKKGFEQLSSVQHCSFGRGKSVVF